MKLFLDTADINEIKEARLMGIIHGVTTNPSLMKKAVTKLKSEGKDIDLKKYISEILKVMDGYPVSLEVKGGTADEMIFQGKTLYEKFNSIANNVVIKIPVNPKISLEGIHYPKDIDEHGIKAIKALSNEGIPVNVTLVFSPGQALLAAHAGATYVSPFAGRIDDDLRKRTGITFDKKGYFPEEGIIDEEGVLLTDNGVCSGIDLVYQIVEMFRMHGIKTEVLAASIRNVRQAREAALVGADVATLPMYIIHEMLNHKKTTEGMTTFFVDVPKEYEELWK